MLIAAYIAMGLLAGVAGGLFGIGGGIVIVPMLVAFLGFAQQKAQGTSLVALLAPVGLLGLMNYWRQNQADLVVGAWIAVGFLGGAYLGSKIALGLSPETMRKTFAIFLMVVSVYLYTRAK